MPVCVLAVYFQLDSLLVAWGEQPEMAQAARLRNESLSLHLSGTLTWLSQRAGLEVEGPEHELTPIWEARV